MVLYRWKNNGENMTEIKLVCAEEVIQPKKYTREKLIEKIQQFAKINGRPPIVKDFINNPNYPCFDTYKRIFGSWNKAIELAGFKYRTGTGYSYTKEELLEEIKIFKIKNGRYPKALDFTNNPEYHGISTYQRTFGTFNNAIELAGFKPRKSGQIYTDEEELLAYINEFERKNGRPPTNEDLTKNPEYPGRTTYSRIFGSLEKAKELISLDIDSVIKKGIIETTNQKGRSFELKVLKYLGENTLDLAKDSYNSPCDGIFEDHTYDAKSSKLHNGKYWLLRFENMQKDFIQTYYLGLYDKNFEKLLYVLKIHACDFVKVIEKGYVYIGIVDSYYEFNIDNMWQYNITEEFKKKTE